MRSETRTDGGIDKLAYKAEVKAKKEFWNRKVGETLRYFNSHRGTPTSRCPLRLERSKGAPERYRNSFASGSTDSLRASF